MNSRDRRAERRRYTDEYREALMEKVLEELSSIRKSNEEIKMTLYQNSVDMRTMADRIASFEKAFPDGPDIHRVHHVNMAKAATAEEEFWFELKRDIIRRGTLFALVIVLGLTLVGLGIKMKLLGADAWTSIWQ